MFSYRVVDISIAASTFPCYAFFLITRLGSTSSYFTLSYHYVRAFNFIAIRGLGHLGLWSEVMPKTNIKISIGISLLSVTSNKSGGRGFAAAVRQPNDNDNTLQFITNRHWDFVPANTRPSPVPCTSLVLSVLGKLNPWSYLAMDRREIGSINPYHLK